MSFYTNFAIPIHAMKKSERKKVNLLVQLNLSLLKAFSMKLGFLPNPQLVLCQTPSILRNGQPTLIWKNI